ncbi:hypothetical protein PVAP13_4KG294805 [Panicum virgatum]|uniref:Uncharacterized protein n=1 Tax=Panicum virgatum TaxID=38727 RepID=A0A8T0TRA6_PANVG|nr:hypothetical protein PVAP13_4KG294805 [Panicum virgatum]
MGINYLGTNGELKGCLVDRFGYDEAGIRVLTDPSTPPPERANVRLELERLVVGALGQGHGAAVPARRCSGECMGAASSSAQSTRASSWGRCIAKQGTGERVEQGARKQRRNGTWQRRCRAVATSTRMG